MPKTKTFTMRIHFISIGGSAMHNLAIALHKKGYQISGSDDEIFEPSKSRLAKHKLLPNKIGWDANIITKSLDAVILGMHAKADNPELLAAQELGIKVYSYPEYIYEQSKDKKRIVIAGSHGKTSITSMVLHVLQKLNKDFDYLVGAQLEGFDTMVKLTNAPLIVIEGDEYLSSPIDRKPKFLWYKPHTAVITGIAWDHINVFPTFKNYVQQFDLFLNSLENGAKVIYYKNDEILHKMIDDTEKDIQRIPYFTHNYLIRNQKTFLIEGALEGGNEISVPIFGEHNLQNLSAALEVCKSIGISQTDFYTAIQSFKGASKRLELIAENESTKIFKDYAHSPSKLKATTVAVKNQFKEKRLIACMELHTFSSLNKNFLAEYAGAMSEADEAIVYFNPKAIQHKGLKMLDKNDIEKAFLPSKVKVYDKSEEILAYITGLALKDSVLLLMTSGNFDGINLDDLAKSLIK